MNHKNVSKGKAYICWGLIVVGIILLLTQSGKNTLLIAGGILSFIGLLLSKKNLPEFIPETIALFAGLAVAALGLFFTHDPSQWICGGLLCFIGFARMLTADISTGDNPQQRYLFHCKRYGLTPNTVQFYFMSTADDYIAIADDGKLYSYIDGTRKSVPLANIDRLEGRGLDSTNTSKYLTVVVYEKNGNYHNYYFSRTTKDFSHFTNCLNAIIEFREKPTESYAEQYERCERLFALGGVDPKIYPEDMYNN